MLKKAVILIFIIMLCISFASCGGKTISITFPFEVTDVTSIDMFYFINPMEAEKKVITQQEDIKSIYQLFERQRDRTRCRRFCNQLSFSSF